MSEIEPSLSQYGLRRQAQLYALGLQGVLPAQPLSVEALEQSAKERLAPAAYDYVAGGAGAEETLQANREAFRHCRIVPRMLRDISRRDLSVELFGTRLQVPVLLAPIGVLSIVHPDAELAVARAASSVGVPFVLSTVASKTLEEAAQAAGEGPRWFQLYWPGDPDLAASFVSRAERAGYGAIVVTLDTAHLGWRERDLQRAYLPFLTGAGLANHLSDPVLRQSLAKPPEEEPEAAIRRALAILTNPSLTWDDLPFLRRHTRLPLLLKGILHPEDAARALASGADGILVSNHGGRQVDGAIGALRALPGVVNAVQGGVPVLFDSGIRRGADAFKAIALGAKAVLLGRPYVWGLAVAGEQGVRDVLLNFLSDFDLTVALSGYASCAELTPDAVWAQGALPSLNHV
jgi:isopentenyl diphosphate isomerase/L-lactate dehydrogenase-like FMN-dependent dehydrogenase